jgi:hypothetical protein
MSKEDFDFLVHAILTHPTLADVWNDVIHPMIQSEINNGTGRMTLVQ